MGGEQQGNEQSAPNPNSNVQPKFIIVKNLRMQVHVQNIKSITKATIMQLMAKDAGSYTASGALMHVQGRAQTARYHLPPHILSSSANIIFYF